MHTHTHARNHARTARTSIKLIALRTHTRCRHAKARARECGCVPVRVRGPKCMPGRGLQAAASAAALLGRGKRRGRRRSGREGDEGLKILRPESSCPHHPVVPAVGLPLRGEGAPNLRDVAGMPRCVHRQVGAERGEEREGALVDQAETSHNHGSVRPAPWNSKTVVPRQVDLVGTPRFDTPAARTAVFGAASKLLDGPMERPIEPGVEAGRAGGELDPIASPLSKSSTMPVRWMGTEAPQRGRKGDE